jgi:TonB-linked SusC/RagA family outer membrane protein
MKKQIKFAALPLLIMSIALLSLSTGLYAQGKRKVSGIVTDAASSEPLAGVTVMVKGTSQGTSTGNDGSYTLSGINEDAVLVFSCIGYVNVEIGSSGKAVINAALSEDRKMLSEVVVIGYGTMDKKELTSAIAHVSSKDFLSSSVSDPLMLIQGKVSGVSIVNTGAADPNNQASIQIRGVSSRAAGLDPLVVIDGVPGGNMANLNQNDIESMDILKDGAASAIYGTRGSNGVVLITTKKGKEDGSIHTSYYGIASANFMIKELDMLTADEYRQYRTSQGTSVDYGGNVDWLREVSRVGLTHQHTLTLSGGNAKNNYRVSADYRKSTGVDRRSEREEYGARASVSHTTKSGLFTFSANIAPRIVNSVGADWNVFHNAIEANPTTPIHDPDNPSMYFSFFGQQASYNPVEAIYTVKDDHQIKMLDWDATAKLNISENFNTQLTFADQQTGNYSSWFRPSTNTESISKGWSGEASKSYGTASQHSLEWLANYHRNFGDHNLKVMAGYSYQYFLNSGVSAENKNFSSDGLTYNSIGQGDWAKEEGHVGMNSYKDDAKLIAFFGRISYDYQGKYLATASLRHEGSSKFGTNNKWGNFPALSLGWRISKEPFMKGLTWIDDLKLRADYGVTGNQNFGSYLSLNTMTTFGNYYYNGQYITVWGAAKNVNPDLRWEKGINWNIGLDFSILDNRIGGSINYFNRTEKDLLGNYNVSIPPYLFPTTFVNVGTMKNSGVEFDLHFNAIDTKDFKYAFDLVGSTMDNRFVSFSNSEYVGQDYYYVAGTEDPFPFHYLQRIEKGKRLGTFYMLKFAGFSQDGDWVIYDKNNEYKIGADATDEDLREVGNGLPKFTVSMTHNFTYKNWDLSLFFRGAFGFSLFNIHEFYYGLPSEVGNVMKLAYSKNAKINGNPIVCDYFLERGDYLKLDVVDLGYTFKLKSNYVENLRVYATGKNILTITGFSGVDPSTYQTNGLQPGATGSRNYYPSCRQAILGVQIDF